MNTHSVLQMLNGGVLTTVQDAGRHDALRYGVPRSGAMDQFALQAANRLLDNPPGAAALEITLGGAIFEVCGPTLLAVTGADLGGLWNDRPLPLWTAFFARAGDQLIWPARRSGTGARAYLALPSGVDVPLVLGSRSTYQPGGFGGLYGRALRAGDQIAAIQHARDVLRLAGRHWPVAARPAYQPAPTLRFIPGPHLDCFAPDALDALCDMPLRVSRQANRMGYRLEGAQLDYARPCSLPSLGVVPGVLQVPPDGAPILLMADAQTTGGYPIVGVVIAPDLPLAAQLAPGDALHLAPISQEQALAARRDYAAWCATVPETDESVAQIGWAGAPASFAR